jgi:hypothetical protein
MGRAWFSRIAIDRMSTTRRVWCVSFRSVFLADDNRVRQRRSAREGRCVAERSCAVRADAGLRGYVGAVGARCFHARARSDRRASGDVTSSRYLGRRELRSVRRMAAPRRARVDSAMRPSSRGDCVYEADTKPDASGRTRPQSFERMLAAGVAALADTRYRHPTMRAQCEARLPATNGISR